MTDFEAFQIYNAIKLHFDSEKYDAVKYQFKTNVKRASFEKRNDRYFFSKIANKFPKKEDLVEYLVANFVMENRWIGDILNEEGERRHTRYLKYKQAETHFFKTDIGVIRSRLNGRQPDYMFLAESGRYPMVVKLMLEGDIKVESVVILNKLFGFIERESKKVKDPILWPSIKRKIQKYSVFYECNEEKLRSICINMLVSSDTNTSV